MAIRDGFRFASISGKPATRSRSGAMNRNCRFAVQVVDASLARGGAVTPGVNALHGEAPLLELGDLVFHQRDQRADHQCRSTARDPRQLVAQRLPGPGRHHQQYVFPIDHRPANGFLVRAERREAEGACSSSSRRASGETGASAARWASRFGCCQASSRQHRREARRRRHCPLFPPPRARTPRCP